MPPPGLGRAPSTAIPLAYLGVAATAFVAAALALPWLAGELAGHYYHPRLLALTHTVTLGWITLTIMGATYQLLPVVIERPVWSERLARWQFVVLVAAVSGMVGHFAIGEWVGLLWAVGLLTAGVGLHLLNVGLSVWGLRRWTFTARLMVVALTGLALTTVFGVTLAVDRVWKVLPTSFFPTLHAHFHLALLGWVLPVVLGVAARVYPMFLLAPEPGGWPGRLQMLGLLGGVPLVVAGLLGDWPRAVAVGALALGGVVAGHGWWMLGIARSRRRPALDWALRFVLTGLGFLVPAAALGLAFGLGLVGGPRFGLAYAVAALGGWVSLTIVGMMLKIVPFLVWYRIYSPRAGREPVPTLADLAWPRAEALAFVLLAGGVALLAAAALAGDLWWLRTAGAAVGAGALAFAAALGRVFLHLAPAAGRERRAGAVGARS